MPLNRCGSVSARFSVWFSRVSALVKLLERGVERLDAAGIERAQRRLAAHQLQRRALLRARLGEEQRAVLEDERGEHQLRPHPRFLARLAPAQAARDHQVDDEKQIVVEGEDDALADAAHAADDRAVDRVDRRIDRAEDERAVEREPLEAAADDVARQRLEVDDDVGEFGHDERLTTSDYFRSQLTICSRVQ